MLSTALFSSLSTGGYCDFGERSQNWRQSTHPDNEIQFEGRFSDAPHSWNGLELSVSATDKGNTFEGVLADISANEDKCPGDLLAEWLNAAVDDFSVLLHRPTPRP